MDVHVRGAFSNNNLISKFGHISGL